MRLPVVSRLLRALPKQPSHGLVEVNADGGVTGDLGKSHADEGQRHGAARLDHGRSIRHRPRDRARVRRDRRKSIRLRHRRGRAGSVRARNCRARSPRAATSPTAATSRTWSRPASPRSAGSTCWSTMPASRGRPRRSRRWIPTTWEKVVAVNLNGTFNVTRCAIPHLKRSAAGAIINMSSVAGRLGYPNRSPYATTKWGLIGFTKTLSMELGEFGIRVNAILPGAVAGPAARPRLRGARQGRRTVGRRDQDPGAGQPVAEGVRRSARRRRAGGVPGVGCREIDLRPGAADRRRPAADDVSVYAALVTTLNARTRSLSSFGPMSSRTS